MKQAILPISEFKAKCLRLVEEVATRGNTLILTKHGCPIAKVSPVSSSYRPLHGSWKGRIKIKGDIVNFNVADEWETRTLPIA